MKLRYSKTIVALIILLNVVFTWRLLQVFEVTSTEPTTLITCWFAFTTGELWLLANIKKNKEKYKYKEDQDYGSDISGTDE